MPRPLGTGLHAKRVKLVDGTIREYFTNRHTGQALGTDRSVAEARMQEWVAAQVPSRPIGRGSLDALITDYLRTDEFRTKKPRTQDIYRHYLEQLRTRFGKMPVAMITIAWVKRLKLDLQDQPARCNQTLAVLRIILKLGMELDYCKTNPAREVSKASQPPRRELWTPAQITAFLGAARGSLQLAMALMLYTAQRLSDVLEMTRGRISERDGRMYIALRQGKTGELLDVPVHRDLLPLLSARLADPAGGLLLVPSPTGRPWLRRNISRAWDDACRKAEVSGVQRRDLRRTAVVLMAQAGLTAGQITSITGHRIDHTAAILNTYLPRRTEVALSGMEAWERAPAPGEFSSVVSLASARRLRTGGER